MSIHLVLGAVLLVCGAVDARAQAAAPAPAVQQPAAAPAPATTPTTLPPLTQSTVVHGNPPDLTGRWLVLFDLQVNAVQRTIPSLLDISTKDGKPEIVEHFVDLPKELTTALDQHNSDKTTWEPTGADLSMLAAQWAALPKAERGVVQVTNDIWEPSAFTDAERQQMEIKESLWVMRQTYAFAPGGQRPVNQVNVFAATGREGSGWRGTAVLAQVASAPFPVPITFRGAFRMLRLEATPPATGLLARILDAFKGCGR
jgi:hypothetical protein